MKYDAIKKLTQAEYDKLSKIVENEIEKIRGHQGWVTSWWKPDYLADRILELLTDINSKNKDIVYIEQYNKPLDLTANSSGKSA